MRSRAMLVPDGVGEGALVDVALLGQMFTIELDIFASLGKQP